MSGRRSVWSWRFAEARRKAAAEARWLRLVAELDRRTGWASSGCRSCAYWLSWQCGVAPVTAREHVRVARRIELAVERFGRIDGTWPRRPAPRRSSPFAATAAEFAAGRLSYSKVRALTRVLTADNEALLLAYAQQATAGQLERLLRGYKSVRDDIEDQAAPDREQARRDPTMGVVVLG